MPRRRKTNTEKKIEKLILGHSYKDNFCDIKNMLMTLAEKKLGYKIEVEISRLAKYYYENLQ